MLKVSWSLGRQSIKCSSTVQHRKFRWIGHILRHDSLLWYNRMQDEWKSYKKKETATNAKWCNQQVLWRFKERGWRQKLVEEKGVINLTRQKTEETRAMPGIWHCEHTNCMSSISDTEVLLINGTVRQFVVVLHSLYTHLPLIAHSHNKKADI